MTRYNTNFERDYQFYLRHLEKFNFCGEKLPDWPYDINGKLAKECFYIFDSRGVKLASSEPILVNKLIATKKAINMQIKEWASGAYDMGEAVEYYLSEFNNPPAWIAKSFREQKIKWLDKNWSRIKKRIAEDNEIYRLQHPEKFGGIA